MLPTKYMTHYEIAEALSAFYQKICFVIPPALDTAKSLVIMFHSTTTLLIYLTTEHASLFKPSLRHSHQQIKKVTRIIANQHTNEQ